MWQELGSEPGSLNYQEKSAQLEELKQLDKQGKIDLYYLDETRFSLIPCCLMDCRISENI